MKALEVDITTLNDFEIKGILLSLIGKANRKQLVRFFEALKTESQSANTDVDTPYALSPEQEAELAEAIEETYHAENLISHEEAMRKLSRWFPDNLNREQRLRNAAMLLLPDYENDKELTFFTAIDGDDFYEYETK